MSDLPSSEELVFTQEVESQDDPFRIGIVTALFSSPAGTAKIRFEGEESASEKQYPYLANYKPAVNDRVVLARIAGTYIILGKIAFNISPPGNGDQTFSGLTVTGSASIGNYLTVSSTTTLNGSLKHTGATVGFFSRTPSGKINVSDPSAIQTTQFAGSSYTSNEQTMLTRLKTDVTNLRSTVLAICDALQNYGLF